MTLHPCPFLKPRREVRNMIYFYAIGQPDTGSSLIRTHVCFIDHRASSSRVGTFYWGTEKSTRLFRVNHQVSAEALELFYSAFPFWFLQTTTAPLVHAVFQDTLTVNARSLVSKENFMIMIWTCPAPYHFDDEAEWRKITITVIQYLPSLRLVQMGFTLIGYDMLEWEVLEVVDRIVKIVNPLKGLPGLVFRKVDKEGQRQRMQHRVREALGCS